MNNFSESLRLSLKTMLIAFGLALCVASFTPVTAASSASEEESAPTIESRDIDVGVIFPFEQIDGHGSLTNEGKRPLRLEKIESRWAGLDANVKFSPRTLLSGESTDVPISIKKDGRVGRFSDVFLVYSNEKVEPIGKIVVRGFVDWIIDPASMTADVGVVSRTRPLSAVLSVKSRPGVDARLVRLSRPNKWIVAEIINSGKSVRLAGKAGMPWGAFNEELVFDTNDSRQKRVSIQVKGEMRGPVVPSTSTIDFGLVRVGVPAEQAVRLEDELGRKLTVGSVTVSGAAAKAVVSECVPASASCKLLKLSLTVDDLGAAPHGTVMIDFPDYSSQLPIAFGGAVIGKDTVIRDLAKEMEAANAATPSVSAALHESATSPNALEMPVPDGHGPLLKWEMANESAIFAYEIYRASAAGGAFERANERLIRRLSNDAKIRSIYRWRDIGAVPGNVYWYYIGVVYLDGRKEALNSPQRVVAK